jgi:hypothetical protein
MRRALLPWSQFTARQLAGDDPLVNGSGCVVWHSTEETSGDADACYTLYDEGIGSGQEILVVALSAGQSTRDYIGPHALAFLGGLFLSADGAIAGSFTCWVDHICETEHNNAQLIRTVEADAIRAAIQAS